MKRSELRRIIHEELQYLAENKYEIGDKVYIKNSKPGYTYGIIKDRNKDGYYLYFPESGDSGGGWKLNDFKSVEKKIK
jgi:poly-D-alanine transfer protein DltD